MCRRVLVVVVAVVCSVGVASPALAQTTAPPITIPGDQGTLGEANNSGDGTIGAGVGVDRAGTNAGTGTGTSTNTGSSGGSGSTTNTTAPTQNGPIWAPTDDPARVGTCNLAGRNGVTIRVCYFDPTAGTPTAPPARTASEIAGDIGTRVLPLPGVQTSPPVGADQLVNLPTWLWVDNWEPQSTSASEAGLTVTVTATPRSVTWRMGMGQPVVCGAGVAWNRNLREEQQSSPCTFTYTWSSAGQPDLKYFASATMAWDVTWTATNGESGSLGAATRRTDFRMRVAEGQALVIG